MTTALIFLALILIVIIFWICFKNFFPLRPKEDGFEFVYVEDDGSVRELDASEKGYLSEKFDPNDGGRPYIKFNYKHLTPKGEISGFIDRRSVPKDIVIKT